MTRVLLFLLLLLLVPGSVVTADDEDSGEPVGPPMPNPDPPTEREKLIRRLRSLYLRGQELFAAGKQAEAEEVYRKVLQLGGSDVYEAWAHHGLAEIFIFGTPQKPALAKKHAIQAVASAPGEWSHHSILGWALLYSGEPERAERSLLAAHDIHPDWITERDLGHFHVECQNWTKARTWYEKAVESYGSGGNYVLNERLFTVGLKLNDIPLVRGAVNRAVLEEPERATERLREVLSDLTSRDRTHLASELIVAWADALYSQLMRDLYSGGRKQAAERLQHAIEKETIRPVRAVLRMMLARIHMGRKETNKARKQLETAIDEAPFHAPLWLSRAELAWADGAKSRAMEFLSEAWRLSKGRADPVWKETLPKGRENQEAYRMLIRGVDAGQFPRTPTLLLDLLRILVERDDLDRAFAVLEAARDTLGTTQERKLKEAKEFESLRNDPRWK